jgi:hypothetical protein
MRPTADSPVNHSPGSAIRPVIQLGAKHKPTREEACQSECYPLSRSLPSLSPLPLSASLSLSVSPTLLSLCHNSAEGDTADTQVGSEPHRAVMQAGVQSASRAGRSIYLQAARQPKTSGQRGSGPSTSRPHGQAFSRPASQGPTTQPCGQAASYSAGQPTSQPASRPTSIKANLVSYRPHPSLSHIRPLSLLKASGRLLSGKHASGHRVRRGSRQAGK